MEFEVCPVGGFNYDHCRVEIGFEQEDAYFAVKNTESFFKSEVE